MEFKIKKILFSEEEIAKRVKELGEQITKDYAGKEITLLCILKGSMIFTADLARRIDLPVQIDVCKAKSYVGSSTTGSVNLASLPEYLADKHIIIVEDIIDTGLTLAALKNAIEEKKPASLKICTFLYKKESVRSNLVPDYYGLICPQEFVVGYGLDYNEEMRQLPYVAALEV